MSDEAKQIFVQESEELLQEMEDALLMMEEDPEDSEHLNSVFRAMHTIKGSGGIFGFDYIVTFTHPVETELDKARSGERPVDQDLIALLLKCKDHAAALVDFASQADTGSKLPDELEQNGQALIAEISAEQTGLTRSEAVIVSADSETPSVEKMFEERAYADKHWLIALDFKPDTFRNGFDPLSFLRYLTNLGEIIEVMTLYRMESNEDEEMDAESCYLSFRIAFNSSATKAEIHDVFEFVADDCDIRILPPQSRQTEYIALLQEAPENETRPLGELLCHIGALTETELNLALDHQSETTSEQEEDRKPLGKILVEQQVINKSVVKEALKKQETIKEKVSKEARSIRVDAQKLGQLINLVGELVISSASMRTKISKLNLPEVNDAASNMELLVEEIRDNALQLRMVQIGETFSRFKRVVRDVSRELGKEINLEINGGESELDKSVIEKLNDPLTHLVRNSLDHGIEMPEERVAAGKPAKGVLTLNAYHDSGHIVVEVFDDGAGLDVEKIRAKAEAKGIVQPDQVLSRQEELQLIFEPGLSTKQEASNLSGRGVGMDVVKRNIDSLRGSIELDSERGKGTRITIRLPLTLAIIDGFLVGIEQESYIIPLSMVQECIEFGADQLQQNKNYVNFRGEVMPFIHLRSFFGLPSAEPVQRESLVIVRFGRARAALVVDNLLGEQQTVIKPLGAVFQNLSGISGATVLGSGDIALILNIQELIERAEQVTGIANKLPDKAAELPLYEN
ncbi:chemotaxis protein CheA [Vibrio sp. JC009]|uniref:chemotaxis protein CheA n=1 Tax=Vibrio sp. JC009 TaxID=2912314 RepID=UPI0023B1B3DA|nr:chemotaxis protein CheA [Vibrio sp. JC009]WED23400.1 chemotaxis protein CheA [Vibrio sp. JC009]